MTEQVERTTTRKKRIIKYAKVFFVIIILFTFLSKTIINLTLPKVSIGRATWGDINREINGRGEIILKEKYEYYTQATFPIKDIKVKVGDRVEKGDIIALLDTEAIDRQIIDRNDSLKISENNLEKLLLDRERMDNESFTYIKNEIMELEAEILNVDDKERLEAEIILKKEELKRKEEEQKRKIEKINIDIRNYELNIEKTEEEIERLNTRYNKYGLRPDEYERLEDQILDREYSLKNTKNYLDKAILDREELKAEDFFVLKSTLEELETKLTNIDRKDEIVLRLERKREELDRTLEEHDRSIRKLEIDIENQELSIGKIRKEIDSLYSERRKSELRAEYSGTIENLNIVVGRSITSAQPVYVLNLVDEGYRVVLELPETQKDIVEEGQDVEIKLTGNEVKRIKGQIDFIQNHSDLSKIKVFMELDGTDYDAGTMVDVRIISEGGRFDVIIPNSAIHKEVGEEYFVYVVQEKDGALGKEYYIKKEEVELGESNYIHTGILSEVHGNHWIVINSNKALEEGMRVVIDDK